MSESSLCSIKDQVIKYSDDVIIAIDNNFKILFVNKKAELALGYSKEELLNSSISNLVVEQEKWQQYISDLEKKEETMCSLRFIHKNKTCLRYDVLLVRWTDKDNNLLGFVLFGKDISRWINFEENLLRIDRLVELGQIAAGIIHELKNPLTIIDQAVGWGKTFINDKHEFSSEDRDEIRHIFEEISKQTERCKNITHHILTFVREKGPEEKRFNLIELIENSIKYIAPEIKYLPVKIEKKFPEEPVFIFSDYNLLQQVLVNLLINAVDAIKEKNIDNHVLELKIEVLPTNIQIYISDTGPGIPVEIRDKIFDLFFTTKPSGKGTGLGLAITRNIIERLGGEIVFESEEGKGTTFIISLPKNED